MSTDPCCGLPRHRHQEFLSFLRHIDGNVHPEFDAHLVVNNYNTHKHAKVKRWLAAKPRYQSTVRRRHLEALT